MYILKRPLLARSKGGKEPNAEVVEQLVAFGFTPRQAKYALQQNDGDANRAAEWLFVSGDQVPEGPSRHHFFYIQFKCDILQIKILK